MQNNKFETTYFDEIVQIRLAFVCKTTESNTPTVKSQSVCKTVEVTDTTKSVCQTTDSDFSNDHKPSTKITLICMAKDKTAFPRDDRQCTQLRIWVIHVQMKPLKRALEKKFADFANTPHAVKKCLYTLDNTIPSTSVCVGTGVLAMTLYTIIKEVDPVLHLHKVFTRWIKTVIYAYLTH